MKYIYEHKNWPNFTWDQTQVNQKLADVKFQQGKLLGKVSSIGFDLQNEAELEIRSNDLVKTSEIEGEKLDLKLVRSSVSNKLEFSSEKYIKNKKIDGLVSVSLDATKNYDKNLTKDRLFDWHKLLFTGVNTQKIIIGDWRDDSFGRMAVVSGVFHKEKIHFEAPKAERIEPEMSLFFNWFNKTENLDNIIKSAIAHFWLVTIHPFDDGNGRLARIISDICLARSDQQEKRFYSMSAQIRNQRKEYYSILESTQKGNLDVSIWVLWFLNCLENALVNSEKIIENILFKHNFWLANISKIKNERQEKIINMLIVGFDGKLTSSKYAKINKCSQDTALRDLNDLVNKKLIKKSSDGGRSTEYFLIK